MEKLNLDFYYGQEADQFTFYRLPKALITDNRFKGITNNAKLLYGLLLDRMSLSKRRGWLDEENRVYIKYALDNIAEDLNVSRKTAGVLLRELESIGLIETVHSIGVANIIYVKNFISEDISDEVEEEPVDQCNNYTSVNFTLVEKSNQCKNNTCEESEPVNSENPRKMGTCEDETRVKNLHQCNLETGTSVEITPVPGKFLHTSKNILENKDNNTNPIILSVREPDSMDETEAYMELIRENIEYDVLMSDKNWKDRVLFDELYQLICDVVCVQRKTIRIAGEDYPYNLVKSRFLKLNSNHLMYVIDCMQSNTSKVANIKAYLITALYNAPNTINHFYNAEVNHDMVGT